MEYLYRHRDWSNVEVLGRNRLPVRPFYCGYPDRESAVKGKKERGERKFPSAERTVEIRIL